MKKQSLSKNKTETKPEVAHLDATITEITASTAERLKKWWKPLVGVLAALFLGLVLYQAVHAFSEQKSANVNDRAHRLFNSLAAAKEDYKLDEAELQSLISDVRGHAIEAFVYRSAVEHYLDQAGKLVRKAKDEAKKSSDPPSPESAGGPAKAPAANLQPAIDEAYNQALKLADEARSKLSGDGEMEAWALKVKARIEGERKRDWLPAKWKYSLPTPKAVESSATPPASPTPSAPPAVEAPAGGQPASK